MSETIQSPSGRKLHKVASRKTTATDDTEIKSVRVSLAKTKRLEENKAYLANANIKAFLSMIGEAEGGNYHAKFGWRPQSDKWTFTDERTHPGPGFDGKTTAAGLYQINDACWREHGIKLQGLTDFSPATQDLIAVDNLRTHHCLESIIAGDIKGPIEKLKAHQWTSFQVRTYEQLEQWFKSAGGKLK